MTLRGFSRAVSDKANQFRLRLRVRRPFAIITNNCWGSAAYRDIGMPYSTPFIGTLVPPECYLRLISDLPAHLDLPLRFIPASRYGWPTTYPIAELGDSEIHFMHYSSPAEAESKWRRRLDRMPRDPAAWRFKFCDHHVSLDPEEGAPLLEAFDRLPLAHKVCFLGRHQPALKCGVILRECLPAGRVPDGHAAYRPSLRYFDAAGWLNGHRAQ
jgi:uncharacterized protein (DUF1919 family)